MKRCPMCGHSNPDYSEFCRNCGNAISDHISAQNDVFDAINDGLDAIKETVSTLFGNRAKRSWNAEDSSVFQTSSDNFTSPDETVQATIGVSYIKSFMSGAGFRNGAAILTDKRLYYFGKTFSNMGKGLNTPIEEGIISVDDITSTRFVLGSPISYLIMAAGFLLPSLILFMNVSSRGTTEFTALLSIATVVLAIVGVSCLITYFTGRSTVLEIAFPGGKYCFDSRWHSASNMREFQRQIHLVKDSMKAGQNAAKGEETETLQ